MEIGSLPLKTAFSLISPGGARARLNILIFHRVLPRRDHLFPDEPDIARFDEIMRWVKHWFDVLPLDIAVEKMKSGRLPARAAAITFDDGYADNFTCALPVLKKYGLHATFFVATGFVDGGRMWNDTVIESVRGATVPDLDCSFLGLGCLPIQSIEEKRTALGAVLPAIKHLPPEKRLEGIQGIANACRSHLPVDLMLSCEQVRALRENGMGIGAHTVSHPILATLESRDAFQEIADSRVFLEGVLNEKINLFAYPNGKIDSDYTSEHVEMVKSLGFLAACSTNWGASNRDSDPFQLPRFTPWDRNKVRFGLRLVVNTL